MGSYGKLPLKEHVLMNWLQNILLIIPHIADVPEIEHLDIVIARLWKSSHLVDRMKDIVAYFQLHAPCCDAAEILLYESLESVCHDGDVIDFVMAVSDSARNKDKEWDERRVMRGVEFQGSARVAAAVLHATGNQMSIQLKEWIIDNAKTLYDIAFAQSLTKEKLLTPDVFDKFKANLYEDQNPYERENFVSLLANYYNFANEDYAELKACIESLADEIPSLKFALNPLEWSDFENIDCRWMSYVTEDMYDDILKNEMARKKFKEYCDSVPWGKEIKEDIWNKF